jgi:DNA-directed RNA polymerase subunit RPC12/RpoP
LNDTVESQRCPYCNSTEILPFEDEEDYKFDYSLWVGIFSGILLIAGYFFFMVISYLTFPLIVFSAVIISSRLVNKRVFRRKDTNEEVYYVCLNCRENFKGVKSF